MIDIVEKMPQDVEFEVHVYGDGKEKENMLQLIQNKKLSDKIILKGSLAHDEMIKAYQSADIFILPSLRESGGTVLTEAMANALPIVSLNQSISKQLSEQKTGLFVDPMLSKDQIIRNFADALSELICSPDLRMKLGMNGYSFVNRELNWDVIFDKVYGTNLEKVKEI